MSCLLTAADYAAAQDILRQVEISRARLGTHSRPRPRDWLDLFERQAIDCHQALEGCQGEALRDQCIRLAALLLEVALRARDPLTNPGPPAA